MLWQDTVIGLQALSEYSIHTRHAELGLSCAVTAEVDARFRREINVDENNADVKQELEVRPLKKWICESGFFFFKSSSVRSCNLVIIERDGYV